MNRHKAREKLMVAIYQHLLLNKEIADVAEDNKTKDEETNNYFYDVFEALIENEEDYISDINTKLIDYDFNGLGVCERAILLIAYSEIKVLDIPKEIVIDEAINLAHKYCDDDAYKIINGVLDKA